MDKGSGQELCEECRIADPPPPPPTTVVKRRPFRGVSCDGCVLWWHVTCIGFSMESRLSQNWLKYNEVYFYNPKLSDAALCNTTVKFPLLPSRFLPINRHDNLDFSFVNLSQVLKGLYTSYLY